jgi:phage FluMu gp28-like protein
MVDDSQFVIPRLDRGIHDRKLDARIKSEHDSQVDMITVIDEIKALQNDGVLLKYQKRWVEDKSPVKVWEKSRRIGATWAEAADDALITATETGMDVFYIGYNKDMAREFVDECASWLRHYQLAAEEVEEFIFKDKTPEGDKDIHAFRIDCASGFKILALSSRPSNLRGKQGIVIIDEAAFHDDLQGLIKAAIALLMWGGFVRIITTHFGEDNPFNDLVNSIREGKLPYSLHRTTLDDALADGLYKRICLVLNREWTPESEAAWRDELIKFYGDHADEELFCVPSKGSGIYFTSALIRSCMKDDIPVLRYTCRDGFDELPDEARRAECQAFIDDNLEPLLKALHKSSLHTRNHFFGEDFARDIDLTVITPLTELQNLTLRAPFIVELRNVPFKQQEQILFYIVDRLPNFRGGAMDARGNGQYLAEVAMQRYGTSRIFQIMLTRQFYQDAMPKYKVRFEDKTIEIPLDADILDDHKVVRLEKGIPLISDTRKVSGEGGKRHGDSAVAGMLGVYASDNAASGPIEYETVAVRSPFSNKDDDSDSRLKMRADDNPHPFRKKGAW